ncbi:hypothetical protein MBLNU459_g0102t2 [Dothideomycetes sp. NU459]
MLQTQPPIRYETIEAIAIDTDADYVGSTRAFVNQWHDLWEPVMNLLGPSYDALLFQPEVSDAQRLNAGQIDHWLRDISMASSNIRARVPRIQDLTRRYQGMKVRSGTIPTREHCLRALDVHYQIRSIYEACVEGLNLMEHVRYNVIPMILIDCGLWPDDVPRFDHQHQPVFVPPPTTMETDETDAFPAFEVQNLAGVPALHASTLTPTESERYSDTDIDTASSLHAPFPTNTTTSSSSSSSNHAPLPNPQQSPLKVLSADWAEPDPDRLPAHSTDSPIDYTLLGRALLTYQPTTAMASTATRSRYDSQRVGPHSRVPLELRAMASQLRSLLGEARGWMLAAARAERRLEALRARAGWRGGSGCAGLDAGIVASARVLDEQLRELFAHARAGREGAELCEEMRGRIAAMGIPKTYGERMAISTIGYFYSRPDRKLYRTRLDKARRDRKRMAHTWDNHLLRRPLPAMVNRRTRRAPSFVDIELQPLVKTPGTYF